MSRELMSRTFGAVLPGKQKKGKKLNRAFRNNIQLKSVGNCVTIKQLLLQEAFSINNIRSFTKDFPPPPIA